MKPIVAYYRVSTQKQAASGPSRGPASRKKGPAKLDRLSRDVHFHDVDHVCLAANSATTHDDILDPGARLWVSEIE